MAIHLRVKPGATYFDVTLGAVGPIGIRSCGRERKDSDENGARTVIHGVTIGWTHWLRQAGASNGSAKYWVSWTTFSSRNSIMLTVKVDRPT